MCSEELAATQMSMKELKIALDDRGVSWRGVCFERTELEAALTRAQEEGSGSEADDAGRQEDLGGEEGASASVKAASTLVDEEARYAAAYEAGLARASGLRVKEIRTELAARSIGWATLFEKSELAATLAAAYARAALFSSSGALEPGSARSLNAEQLRQEMQDGRTPMLLDVYATWCGPCKLLAPQLEQLAAELGSSCRVAKLDSDAEPQLSTELNVAGLPTLIFLRGDGSQLSEAFRVEGVPGNAAALRQLVVQHLEV